MKRFVNPILAILICQLAGLLGSFFTAPAIPTWYAGLSKPNFSPPDWLFGPVWVTLYALMGITAYLVWKERFNKKEVKVALVIFTIQLIFNTLWSVIFFGLRSPLYALFEIVFLWLLILLTIAKFFKISKAAAYLLLPYLFWVSFATILNIYIVKLN